MIGRDPLVLVAHDHAAPLGAEEHLVLGALEVGHRDLLALAPRGEERRLVHEVLEVGADEARRAAREHFELDVVGQRDAARVHLQDREAAAQIGSRHDDAAVEAPGPEQRRVEHVGPVGGRDHDHAFVALEAVHLDEELVQRLLALVVPAAEAGAAMAADRVDLVDEDDARRVLLALHEEVADPRGADADEHLHEVGAGDREERNAGLARDGAREERLARAGRPDEQHPLRDAAAEARELLRVLQERDDLFELVLRLLDARDVVEGDALLVLVEETRARLAEAHRLAAACLHLSDEEDPEPDQDDEGHPPDQHLLPDRRLALRPRGDLDALLLELRNERVVDRGDVRRELAVVLVLAADVALFHRDARDLAGLELRDEVAVGDLLRCRLALTQDRDEQQDHHQQDDP